MEAQTMTDGVLCSPGSIVQFHAVWHVLAAVSLGCWWRSWTLRSAGPVSSEHADARVNA